MFKGRAKLTQENAVLSMQLEMLEKQIAQLSAEREQNAALIRDLTRALIAKESPAAYADNRQDELRKDPTFSETMRKSEQETKAWRDYIRDLESPQTLRSVEDLESVFAADLASVPPESLHDDGES
jgi:hypothetical protein